MALKSSRSSSKADFGINIAVILTGLLSVAVKTAFIIIAAIFLLGTPFAWLDFFLLAILANFIVSFIREWRIESRKLDVHNAALKAFEDELNRISKESVGE